MGKVSVGLDTQNFGTLARTICASMPNLAECGYEAKSVLKRGDEFRYYGHLHFQLVMNEKSVVR